MGGRGGYHYIGTQTNGVLVLAVKPTSIYNKLRRPIQFTIFGSPKIHLGCEYLQFKKVNTAWWVMVSPTYTAESISKVLPHLRNLLYLCTSAIVPKTTVGLDKLINCVLMTLEVRLG